MGNTKIKYESVKINTDTIKLLRENKNKTGVPISTFIDKLIRKALGKK